MSISRFTPTGTGWLKFTVDCDSGSGVVSPTDFKRVISGLLVHLPGSHSARRLMDAAIRAVAAKGGLAEHAGEDQ